MERYGRINEEELGLVKRVLFKQDPSLWRDYPYMQPRLVIEKEPSLEERAALYNEIASKTFVLGGITSVVLAIATPFKNISFGTFVIILFASRLADILSTIFCLRMPWAFESNPYSEAHRLSPGCIFKNLAGILLCLVPIYLLNLWFPEVVKVLLLTYAVAGFIAAASNLYQTFSLARSSAMVFVVSNSIVGTGVFFLLKFLSQAY